MAADRAYELVQLKLVMPGENFPRIRFGVPSQSLSRTSRTAEFLLAFASVACGVLVAAPAFAIAVGTIDFSTAEPAPESAKLQFAELNTAAPPGMAPGVDAKEARSVLTRDLHNGPRTLWAAPTRGGGFCLTLERAANTCFAPQREALSWMGAGGSGNTPMVFFGAINVPEASYVEVLYRDGTTTKTELVWVSPPLDAGFFVIELPKKDGIAAFVARDAEGRELARSAPPPGARAFRS